MSRSSLLIVLLATGVPPSVAGPSGPWPDCAEDNLEGCPGDLNDWTELSWVPENSKDTVRPFEAEWGAGLREDIALRLTGGRFDVTVAVMDSGILWEDRQLRTKVLLNTAELPLPQGADGADVGRYDFDGDGIVTVDDWSADPRVSSDLGVDEADNMLDASDLIVAFSDGVDDDDNGYPDDIAGWDFYEHDNDPYASFGTGYYNHGTGVMKTAVAWAGDGGDLGTCPNCSLLPLRIGDAFVTEGDTLSLAIAYAADRGARAASMATGGLTHSRSTSAAVHYADDLGMVMVGAGGDENAWHRNLPASDSPFLYVKSIRADNRSEGNGGVFSYMNTWNCNNFGPRMDLAAPAGECATGATARIAGAAGLVVSAGRENGVELTAPQVRALLRGTATDIHLSDDERARAKALPSKEGWDAYHGYGRLDLGSAIEAVYDGELPPSVKLIGPRWFSHATDAVVVSARIEAPGAAIERWTIEVGTGMEPDDWSEVASGSGEQDGDLATIDLSAYGEHSFEPLSPITTMLERADRAHEPLVQLRLRVTGANGTTAEERTAVWVHRDETLLPGWPKSFDSSVESSANLVDLDGDGILEILFAESSGLVHAMRVDGTEISGFPKQTSVLPFLADSFWDRAPAFQEIGPLREGILSTPAAGDVDGDGSPEIVATTLAGGIYAWHIDGSLLDGFPVYIEGREAPFGANNSWDDAIFGSPALADVDGDGDLDIITGAGDQRLYVIDDDGSDFAGFPLELCHADLCGKSGARIVSSPAVGDIDGDGHLEVAIGTNEVPIGAAGLLYVVDLVDAQVQSGFPLKRPGLVNQTLLPVIGEGHVSSPALADLDGDGDLEIASAPMLGTNNLVHHDASSSIQPGYVATQFGPAASFTDGS
ncbi:MAG: hypothetical protein ACI9MC_001159, partial [Kiritimatiellia bacterium]